MTVTEKICEMVQALPEEQAAEVLTFVESVHAKHRDTKKEYSKEEMDAMSWPELVDALAGSWGDDFPTLEEIRAGEGKDSPRESF